MGFIMQVVNTLLWMPINWILQLLGAVQEAMEFLSQDLLEMVLFGKQTPDFQDVVLPVVYYRLMIVALGIWFVIFTCSVICYYVKDANGDETPLSHKIGRSLINSFYATALLFIVPMLIWLLIKFTNSLGDILVLAFGGASANLADLLYSIGDPNWDGVVVSHNGSFPMPSNIGEWNMIVELFSTVVVLLCMLLILINIITQIFSMYFYFIATFVFAIKMVFDDGEGMKEYAKTMIANALMISATLFSFNVFASLLGSVNTLLNQATVTGGAITKMLLMVAMCVGGAMFLINSGEYISQMIGQNIAGISNAKDSLGMVMAGAFLTANIAKGALSRGKRLLNGKQGDGQNNGGNGANPNAASGNVDGQDPNSNGENGDIDKQATEGSATMNRVRQAAATRRRGGLLGLMGRTAGGAMNIGKGAYLAGKSVLGSKASRAQGRMQLKQHAVQMGQSMSSVAGGVIGSVLGGAGIIAGTVGIPKMIKAHKNAKIRSYGAETNSATINGQNINSEYKNQIANETYHSYRSKALKLKAKSQKIAEKKKGLSPSKITNLKSSLYSKKADKLSLKAQKLEAKGKEKAQNFQSKADEWKLNKFGEGEGESRVLNEQKFKNAFEKAQVDLKKEYFDKIKKENTKK